MFTHARRSVNGSTIPSWLKPGPIYVKKHVRSKNDPEVEEVDLIEANPAYAYFRFRHGRETTVSIRDIAFLLMLRIMKLYVMLINLLWMIHPIFLKMM